MAQPRKQSSSRVYQSKWDCFSDWCSTKERDPCQASVVLVADFLVHLHEDTQLSYSMIEGYRAALGYVLKATNILDISSDVHISNLMVNFAREPRRAKSSIPSWNLSLVLQGLT